jgi:hypothetical protein
MKFCRYLAEPTGFFFAIHNSIYQRRFSASSAEGELAHDEQFFSFVKGYTAGTVASLASNPLFPLLY